MKKIIKSICFSLLAFMFAIGSIFLPIGSKNTSQYASADTTIGDNRVTFTSSNIFFTALGNKTATVSEASSTDFSYYLYQSGSSSNQIYFAFQNVQFQIIRHSVAYNNRAELWFQMKSYTSDSSGIGSLEADDVPSRDWYTLATNVMAWPNETFITSGNRLYIDSRSLPIIQGGNTNRRTMVAYGCIMPTSEVNPDNLAPSLEMVSVELCSGDYFNNYFYDISDEITGNNFNACVYTDSVGYKYFFLIACWQAYNTTDLVLNSCYFDYRRYFFDDGLGATNNEYYQQGLVEGEALGYQNGYNEGLTLGTNYGYNNGYQDGYLEGGLESENFTFVGLFSAILDTPVKILTNLFNFDFLGINLWAFFTSILTIGLIVFVVKIFLRR